MFVATTKKGSGFINALTLFAIVFVAAVVALSLVKIVQDPKNPTGFRNTLGLGKKKF
jgi:predicted lipoprotein